jgi:hypothetical protein
VGVDSNIEAGHCFNAWEFAAKEEVLIFVGSLSKF